MPQGQWLAFVLLSISFLLLEKYFDVCVQTLYIYIYDHDRLSHVLRPIWRCTCIFILPLYHGEL